MYKFSVVQLRNMWTMFEGHTWILIGSWIKNAVAHTAWKIKDPKARLNIFAPVEKSK